MERVHSPRWMHMVWLTCYIETIYICVWAIRFGPESPGWMMVMLFVIVGYIFFVATPFGEDIGVLNTEW